MDKTHDPKNRTTNQPDAEATSSSTRTYTNTNLQDSTLSAKQDLDKTVVNSVDDDVLNAYQKIKKRYSAAFKKLAE